MISFCTGHVEDFCSRHANSLLYPDLTLSALLQQSATGVCGGIQAVHVPFWFHCIQDTKRRSHLVCTGTGILNTVISCSARVSLPWSERITMYPECQTSRCSTVNPSGCLKCSLRRSLIQSLSAGSTFPLIPGLGTLGLDGCLAEMHEMRGRGAKTRQHLTENPDALSCSGRNKCVFPVTSQCYCWKDPNLAGGPLLGGELLS